jgi:serine protease AprX
MRLDVLTLNPPARPKSLRKSLLRAACLTLIALLGLVPAAGAPVSGPPVADPRANASHGQARLAPDLLQTLQKRSPNDKVRLVVTLDGFNSREVTDLVRALGGQVRGVYPSIGEMVLDLPLGSVTRLRQSANLSYIAPDRPVNGVLSHLEVTTGSAQVYAGLTPLLPFGPTGYDGSGVGVAVLDSGIDPNHFDLRTGGTRRTIVNFDFLGLGSTDDPYGHGTHVAGIIAGNGTSSSQLARDFAGIAPGANLLNLKVLDGRGHGYVSGVVAAIDYTIAHRELFNIRVLNLSLAAPPVESYRDDPLCQAIDRASLAGLVVVVAAGNYGLDPYGNKVYGGITSPGISPAAITVGATNTHATDLRSDDTVARYSSRGPTRSRSVDPATGETIYDNLPKPDLVAPGVRIVSLERYQNLIVQSHPELHVYTGSAPSRSSYMLLSGTSMAAPVVSGAVALMLQANPSLSPNQVKAILMYTAQMMDGPDLFEQGAGMLNVDGAVRLARVLSRKAGSLVAGQKLISSLPQQQSFIAGESIAWSQGLIWGNAWASGSAIVSQQQLAYAQSLIWGMRDTSWTSGVTISGGLFSDDHVVFGRDTQWVYVQWDQGTTGPGGALYRQALSASGVPWENGIIDEAFFTLDPATLIWGYSRYSYDLSLIWGRADGFGESLIWGNTGVSGESLLWGRYDR